ncbi:peroxiredoxin [Laccaria bicolor S238N-H82]|uniref:Putative peroxiredoxin n=1 Tax=Laccaria bicolor (strain S238N-H82 / ATCC MYA-4686) TaxID=486041 RepID=B0D616_LACBS|nr:peroxiredoxin [Laccaria bicolor S238N-H82]EDR09865.1 peroxiredoxin [Laccaria bicolor S238N-H82]|eukprot:XP_001879250.1 peroxiredoxin [Laccaria bicolor S238N-H82]
MSLKVGDTIPEGSFKYIPYTSELEDSVTTALSTNEWKGKKVVLFSVPGAFTPTCHANHLPGYLQNYDAFKAKGVDVIAVVAANDAFVMSGWGRFEGVKDKILTLTDTDAKWSASLGLDKDLSAAGLGHRTWRFAIVIDDLVVKYIGVEPGPGVTVSGASEVLAKL